MRGWKRCAAAMAAAGGIALPAAAEPLPRERVPEPLRPWVDWALRGYEQGLCPFLHGLPDRHQCVWPARLELELDGRGGRFRQDWLVQRESWVPLPGDERRWPREVQVGGQPAVVVAVAGRPGVRLPPGRHAVRGAFRWDALPDLLPTPPETGLVRLSLDGRPVPFPVRDEGGRLWLRERGAEGGEEARLEVDVHRRLDDDVPLRLTTRVELKVSGASREVLLGRALPEGFTPLRLGGPLPARIEPDGRLRVQVRPGTWPIEIEARHDRPAEELALPEPGGPWDAQEVWTFAAAPSLRLVEVEGPPQVDPQQTRLPPEWRSLPAYLMEAKAVLRLVERRRGDAEPAPDRLALERRWWLDFDGGGYTVADRISGVIQRSSRLRMGPRAELGRVAVDGVDQLITREAEGTAVGVEVARGPLRLEADSRLAGRNGALSAVDWEQDFESLSGRLNLPPGWRLLHASGVDTASETWLNRWTLLDLFVVLVAATAFLRLWGRTWGGLALVALALSYTQPAAPRFVWIAVLVGEALRRALGAGRLARWVSLYRGAALAALLLIAIPFALGELRGALYPSLEPPGGAVGEGFAPPAELAAEAKGVRREDRRARAGRLERAVEELADAALPAEAPSRAYLAPDPSARITTGPGLPSWSWRAVELSWNGPVERGQELRLYLLAPGASRALAVVRVALLTALVLCALGVWPSGARRPGFTAISVLALWPLAAALLAAGPARADLPDEKLLAELRARLLERPECHPHCAAIARLRLEVEPAALRARLDVDAAAHAAIPLPVGTRDYLPQTVLVDGAPAAGLLRADGVLWLPLAPGRHDVRLQGPLPERETVEIPLPLRPYRVEVEARGWRVHGLQEDGLVEGSLQLSRIRPRGDRRPDRLEPGVLPPFVRVERSLVLGLVWEGWTRVVRLSPPGTTLVLEVPLLAGEAVTSPGVGTDAGRALVSMGPGVREVSWQSLLEQRPRIALQAPEGVPWSETWRLDASPLWHVEAEGIPAVHQPPQDAPGRSREWRPWPGERVMLAVTRPQGVEGATLTIDSSTLEVAPGLRAVDSVLRLRLRSSRGGQHRLTLPEGADLQSASLDGVVQPLRQEGRYVTIPLVPGSRSVELVWREPRGAGFWFPTSEVDLGAPSVDAELQVRAPAGRWTLSVGGPRLGPAVLFWPLLVLLALVAGLLGRIRITPLRAPHWFLLGIGLTQVPLWAAATVAAWLLVLGWRREWGTQVPGRWFDGVQLLLVAGTFVALLTLTFSIRQGLLGLPEMQIGGNGSSAQLLRWYQDRAEATLPQAWVLSVPLLAYRFAMLAWALWLAQAVVRWLRWGWQCFTADETWRPLRGQRAAPAGG